MSSNPLGAQLVPFPTDHHPLIARVNYGKPTRTEPAVTYASNPENLWIRLETGGNQDGHTALLCNPPPFART